MQKLDEVTELMSQPMFGETLDDVSLFESEDPIEEAVLLDDFPSFFKIYICSFKNPQLYLVPLVVDAVCLLKQYNALPLIL